MELYNLQKIVKSLNTLAEVEQEHPVIGSQLRRFFKDVRTSCNQAYGRLSAVFMSVLRLPAKPTEKQLDVVSRELSDAPDSKWFKEVAGICDRLAALSVQYKPQLETQINYLNQSAFISPEPNKCEITPSYDKMISLGELLDILQRHEGDLKDDIRSAAGNLLALLGDAKTTGNTQDAKSYALEVEQEIRAGNDQIAKLSLQIEGGSSKGAEAILRSGDLAEAALRRPERMLILSMFFLIVMFSLGAFAFRFLVFYQFILLSGFSLTTVIVVNAFYLRTIDKLSQENFLKLMGLALLKFFAPFTRSVPRSDP